jgi:prephenate dehydrogenase
VRKIAIIGLGLVGGSLALAFKKKLDASVEVVGCSRRKETLAKAEKAGAIDRWAADPGSAVRGADLVVVATPVMTIRHVLEEIGRRLQPQAIVTDTGSTKGSVMRWAAEYLPPGIGFVGGHPMAGKETSGFDEANADLFVDCVYCLTPGPGAGERMVDDLEGVIRAIGARPVRIAAGEHDALVAGVSHLPMVLSAAFVSATMDSDSWPRMAKLAARGFRDVSRLAGGNPDMNRDICLTNREEIIRWLDAYVEELRKYRDSLSGAGAELGELLDHAREARERWLREEGW